MVILLYMSWYGHDESTLSRMYDDIAYNHENPTPGGKIMISKLYWPIYLVLSSFKAQLFATLTKITFLTITLTRKDHQPPERDRCLPRGPKRLRLWKRQAGFVFAGLSILQFGEDDDHGRTNVTKMLILMLVAGAERRKDRWCIWNWQNS